MKNIIKANKTAVIPTEKAICLGRKFFVKPESTAKITAVNEVVRKKEVLFIKSLFCPLNKNSVVFISKLEIFPENISRKATPVQLQKYQLHC